MSSMSTPGFPGQTVLIVDDTPANVGVLADYLEQHGFSVVVAQDGEEALRRAQFVQPDLILLDIMMPGIGGFETCRHLKADPATCDIPVIFMTALTEADDKVSGFGAGGVDYVTKPFQIEEVLARINTHLRLRALQKELAAQNLQLQKSAAEINALYNNASCGYHSLDQDGVFVQINDTELKWLGWTRDEIVGKVKFSDLVTAKSLAAFHEKFPQIKQHGWLGDLHGIEFELVRKDGTIVPILVNANAIQEAGSHGALNRFTVFDITERKQIDERIRHMALHDALTGLPNRGLLQDRVRRDIVQARRNQNLVAVLFIDLDHFKQINDSFGHHVGDQLLQLVAVRLQACLREGDSVARLGGDEFVVSLPGLTSGQGAALVADKILDVLNQPLAVEGHPLSQIGGSIGISLYPADGVNEKTLMQNADTAMYHAKKKGRGNYQFFTPELDAAMLANDRRPELS